MKRFKKGTLRRAVSVVMSAVLLVAGMQTLPDAEPAEANSSITDFTNESFPVPDFTWSTENYDGTKNAYIETGGGTSAASVLAGLEDYPGKPSQENYYVVKPAGTPYIRYKEIGILEDNGVRTKVDLKVTMTDWKVTDTAKSDQYAAFSYGGPGVLMRGLDWADFKYEFFIAGTTTPVQVNGVFTLEDLDNSQYFGLTADSNVQQVAVDDNMWLVNESDDYKHIYMDSGDATWTYINSSATALQGDEVTRYALGEDTPQTVEGAYKSGFVSFSFDSKAVTFRFGADGENGNGGLDSYRLYQHVFGLTPKSIGTYEAPTPSKYVSATNAPGSYTADVTLNAGSRKAYYVVDVYLPYSYAHNYSAFSFTDTLNDVYDMSETKVKVYRGRSSFFDADGSDGYDVTGWFDITKDGQTVTASAKDSTIAKDSSFFGYHYQLWIETQIRDSLTLNDFASKENRDAWGISEVNDLYVIPNTCRCTTGVYDPTLNSNKGGYKTGVTESNKVRVRFTEPVLKITKQVATSADAAKGVWSTETTAEYNDTVKYRITVTQTTPGAVLTGLKVADTSLQNNKHLQAGAAAGTLTYNGTGKPVPVTLDGNAVTLGSFTSLVTGKTNELGYGEELTVTFDALVKRAGDVTNTAVADADNGLHGYVKSDRHCRQPEELKIEESAEPIPL